MSSLSLDYTNCLASAIGATHGLTNSELETLVAKIPKHHENVAGLRTSGESAWFDLPGQDTTTVRQLIDQHQGHWQDVVLVGIGGATIAPNAILRTLVPLEANLLPTSKRSGPRVLTIHNLDPQEINETLAVVEPKKTLFYVISRSGSSAELTAVLLWLAAWLKKKAGKTAVSKQIVVATDIEHSPLATWAHKEKVATLHLPEKLGDRFGAFGNATLFPLGLSGIAIDKLLAGAQSMEKRCWQGDAWTNPAYMHALIHYLLTRKRRKTIHAMVGFSRRLHGALDWCDHLIAVSLGKMLNRKGKAVHVGPTPSSCLGPSGLHGEMQLYAEGPFDKVTTFVRVRDHGPEICVPAVHGLDEAVDFCGGHPLASLIEHSYDTAAQDITASGRPNMTVILDDISPESIGCFCYMMQLSTVMSAELYGIDPFNQPGIDQGKQVLYGLMGRSGFEDKVTLIQQYRDAPTKTC